MFVDDLDLRTELSVKCQRFDGTSIGAEVLLQSRVRLVVFLDEQGFRRSSVFPSARRDFESGQPDMDGRVLKLLVLALPRAREAVDVDESNRSVS